MANYSRRNRKNTKQEAVLICGLFLCLVVLLAFVVNGVTESGPSPFSSSPFEDIAELTLIEDENSDESEQGAAATTETATVPPDVSELTYGVYISSVKPESNSWEDNNWSQTVEISSVPEFDGSSPWYVLNGNEPYFETNELSTTSYVLLSEKDTEGRVGIAVACLGKDLMPTGERGDISSVTPTGWVQAKYGFVDGTWLYNRSHVVGWQLCGLNAESRNLMTGTRYFNVQGMLPYENLVADYIRETGNHVMYRITPIFDGDNALADGIIMEGYSVEDSGEDVCFCVFCYNAQPGVIIDYSTGKSMEDKAWSDKAA